MHDYFCSRTADVVRFGDQGQAQSAGSERNFLNLQTTKGSWACQVAASALSAHWMVLYAEASSEIIPFKLPQPAACVAGRQGSVTTAQAD